MGDFAQDFIAHVGKAMGLTYEQLSADYVSAERSAWIINAEQKRLYIQEHLKPLAQRVYKAWARRQSRLLYLIYSDDPRQRKRGRRMVKQGKLPLFGDGK